MNSNSSFRDRQPAPAIILDRALAQITRRAPEYRMQCYSGPVQFCWLASLARPEPAVARRSHPTAQPTIAGLRADQIDWGSLPTDGLDRQATRDPGLLTVKIDAGHPVKQAVKLFPQLDPTIKTCRASATVDQGGFAVKKLPLHCSSGQKIRLASSAQRQLPAEPFQPPIHGLHGEVEITFAAARRQPLTQLL